MATKTLKYSEEELVALLKQNQRHAFEYLYDNYSGALYGIIHKIVKVEEKAEDIMQDVFLKIWKKIADFDGQRASLYTWMMNIARNAAIDLYRKEKNKYHEDFDTQIIKLDSMKHEEFSVNTMDMQKLVSQLKPERRELLDLVYLQGYTQQEAAEELKIPLGTAKSRIRTALQDLKQIFAA